MLQDKQLASFWFVPFKHTTINSIFFSIRKIVIINSSLYLGEQINEGNTLNFYRIDKVFDKLPIDIQQDYVSFIQVETIVLRFKHLNKTVYISILMNPLPMERAGFRYDSYGPPRQKILKVANKKNTNFGIYTVFAV